MAARKPRPATPEQLLGALSDIALGRCSYPETDKTGKVIQQMPDVSARLKALELLGKRYRLFSEPAAEPGAGELRVTVRVVDQLEREPPG